MKPDYCSFIKRTLVILPLVCPAVPVLAQEPTQTELVAAQPEMEKAALLLAEGRKLYAEDNMFEAMPKLKEAAELGLPEAQGFWAYVLQQGSMVSEAIAMYQQAEAKGDLFSKQQLAGYYLRGDAVPKDEARGISLLNEAVAAGYAPAMVSLATLHEQGNYGINQDDAKALALYEAAAKLNDLNALAKLRLVYQKGLLGQAVDPAKAAAYGEQSSKLQAEQGNKP